MSIFEKSIIVFAEQWAAQSRMRSQDHRHCDTWGTLKKTEKNVPTDILLIDSLTLRALLPSFLCGTLASKVTLPKRAVIPNRIRLPLDIPMSGHFVMGGSLGPPTIPYDFCTISYFPLIIFHYFLTKSRNPDQNKPP